MKPAFRLLAPVLLAASAGTWAEDNWYIGGAYHYSQIDDAKSEVLNPGTMPGLTIPLDENNNISIGGSAAQGEPFDIKYDDGDGFGLFFGYDFIGLLRADLELRQLTNDIDRLEDDDPATPEKPSGEIESLSLLANVWADFNRDGVLRPYVGLGLGASRVELLDFDNDTVLIGQVGAGVNWHITDHFALDLGVRYFDTDDPEFESDFGTDLRTEYRGGTARLALRYNFPPRERPPADSDGDGVPDNRDHCPGTPPGVPVNDKGCPDSDGDGVADNLDRCPDTLPGTPVNEFGCPDSDGDGVPDSRDKCPNTPAGVAVNAEGCPDSDGDGVADNLDACPATPQGQPVMADGCGVGQSSILQGVNFEFDRARLTPTAEDILERVAEVLKDSPGFVVELQGHTDSLGSEEYNHKLSQERAEAVREFLISQGVSEERVIARGYGETKPIADNSNPENRASNRRVEMRVLEQAPE